MRHPAPARTVKTTITSAAQMFVARRITIEIRSLGPAHEREEPTDPADQRNDCCNRSEVQQFGRASHHGAECVLGGEDSQNQ